MSEEGKVLISCGDVCFPDFCEHRSDRAETKSRHLRRRQEEEITEHVLVINDCYEHGSVSYQTSLLQCSPHCCVG